MQRKKLRVFAATLVLAVGLQPVMSTFSQYEVYAANYLPDALTETYSSKAFEYLHDTESNFNKAVSGQAGLLSRLDDLQQYSMVLYYLVLYQEELNLDGCSNKNSDIRKYAEKFSDMCSKFDASFSKKSTNYTPLKIKFDSDNVKDDAKLKQALRKLCRDTIPDYLNTLLSDIKKETTKMDQDKILSNYGVLLSNIYAVFDGKDDMFDNITNISPYKSQSDISSPIKFSTKFEINKNYEQLKKDFEDLLNTGAQVQALIGSSSVITIDPKLEFAANMANVTVTDGNVVIPDGVQLSQAYLAILAAGATYVPFSSYVGESSFKAALKSIPSDESVVDSLVDFYDDTKSFRKPLFKRSLSNEGVPTGRADLITVKDFIDDIENGTEGALVTIAGKFTYDTKNNYWVFADTYQTNQDEDALNNATDDEDYSENADATLSEAEVSEEEASEAVENSTESGNNSSSSSSSIVRSVSKPTKQDDSFKIYYKSASYEVCYKLGDDKLVIGTKNVGKGEKKYKTDNMLFKKGTTFGDVIKDCEDEQGVPKNYRLSEDSNAQSFCDTKYSAKKDKKGYPTYFLAFMDLYIALKGNGNFEGINSNEKSAKAEGLTTVNAAEIPSSMKGAGNGDNSTGESSGTSGSEKEESSGTSSGESSSESSGSTSSSESSSESSGSTSSSESTGTGTTSSTESSESTEQSTEEGQTSMTSTVQTTVNTSELSGMSVNSKDVPGIMADKVITSEDKMSEPIMLYGAKHARSTDNLTTLIMRNIIAGTVGCKQMYEESNDYLYVNAYGDIMTDDGMVILPGIANPIFYNAKSKYNPYTAAFMNYYPTILENTNFFQVATENDIGKMIIMNDSADSLDDGSLDPKSLITNKATIITSINDVKVTAPISVPEMETNFYYNNFETKQLLGYDRLIFGDSSTWSKDGSNMYAYTPLLIQSQMSSGGVPIFPYNVNDDRDTKNGSSGNSSASYSCAELIAQNMFHYLTTDKTGQSANLGYLNDNYIVYYFCVSNLNGTANPLAFANADTDSYNRYVSDAELRKESSLLQVSQKIMKSLGYVDQVIGIKTSAQDSILGPVFAAIKEHWLMALMLLIIILLFAFARVSRNGVQSITLLCLCTAFAYLFVNIFPTYLPLAYNSVINNVSENLAYEIFAVKSESNGINKVDTVALDDDGNYKYDTSSLTLYRVSKDKLNDFYNGLGITEADVVGGKTYIINQEAGLFVEGDCIKINTDVLFKTLEISGSFDADTSNYYLEATKTVSNNVDYYTPYYDFVQQFIGKLNDLTTVYAIPRTMTKYSDDIVKDNYLVYSYVNSLPFLTPGVYDSYSPKDQAILSSDQLQYLLENQKEVADNLKKTFGDNTGASDWLGITDFFYNLDPKYQQTVWAETMYDNGYYTYDAATKTDWVPNREKINDLCNYVNTQAKKFVYSMEGQIGTLSDDVMIKVITLRELTAFTQYVSDMGHWLYPFSLNYQEMNLEDVLSCVMTSDYYELVGQHMDICSYILVEYGWLHLLLFDGIVILLFVICIVIHFVVPLMYLLLGVLLLAKMINNSDIKVPIKGYLKCTLIAMFCSTMLCAGVVLTNKLHGSVICIYFLLGILVLIGTVLLTMLTSLITNITDFGNTAINARVEGATNKFSNYRYRANNTNIYTRNANRSKTPSHDLHNLVNKYSNSRSVDDFYDDSMSTNYDNYTSNVNLDDYDDLDDIDYTIEPEITRSDHLDVK